ncbi:dihydroxyacetone kinase subunit L [Tessaracoccus sp. HDW20]|uniref:dihydroxyacetone kinase subunit DhaL n=1 Tax=Tessaracoccus coleopterorum TaxID=2714950 RepID=UPI0018D2E628|nr:dihydroxyacetone kinase subunit DhaL [Tessaracoccus coleopterorum]NHB85935.1 dihydroxyacetone kinase subunit L [Tessaracoccus coleopterorum]
MSGTLTDVERVIHTLAETIVENEQYFGELDAVVGDGDFGYSLARGFEIVLEHWDDYDRSDPGVFVTKVAMAISSRIGGTSGPIWGTAFLRMGMALKGSDSFGSDDVVQGLRAAIEGIKTRGQADLGDKTLLDALSPATDALEAAMADGATQADAARAFATTARTAAEATQSMQAMRGRAAYTGERSIGSVDAGAMAVAVLAERLADTWPTT